MLRESNKNTRPDRTPEHPLLGWDHNTEIDPKIQQHFIEERGFVFYGESEADLLDELAEHAAARHTEMDPEIGKVKSVWTRGPRDAARTCLRQDWFSKEPQAQGRLQVPLLRTLILQN